MHIQSSPIKWFLQLVMHFVKFCVCNYNHKFNQKTLDYWTGNQIRSTECLNFHIIIPKRTFCTNFSFLRNTFYEIIFLRLDSDPWNIASLGNCPQVNYFSNDVDINNQNISKKCIRNGRSILHIYIYIELSASYQQI